MKVVINRNRSDMGLALVYCTGQPDVDRIFMDDCDSSIESFSSRNGKLLICGDSNY